MKREMETEEGGYRQSKSSGKEEYKPLDRRRKMRQKAAQKQLRKYMKDSRDKKKK